MTSWNNNERVLLERRLNKKITKSELGDPNSSFLIRAE